MATRSRKARRWSNCSDRLEIAPSFVKTKEGALTEIRDKLAPAYKGASDF